MKGLIKIIVLEIDNDDIQFQIEIENHSCKTSLDFYGNADDFKKFGQELTDFPKSMTDIVEFKLGENDRKWAYYMLIKAFCYDASGHTALRILVDNFGDISSGYRTEFTIFSEAASINLLGQKLMTWNPFITKEIVWESFAA